MFFFNDTATTEIYTLSLHDALPIYDGAGDFHEGLVADLQALEQPARLLQLRAHARDRKSTRLNSSHVAISYAVFCLKKKKEAERPRTRSWRARDRSNGADQPERRCL